MASQLRNNFRFCRGVLLCPLRVSCCAHLLHVGAAAAAAAADDDDDCIILESEKEAEEKPKPKRKRAPKNPPAEKAAKEGDGANGEKKPKKARQTLPRLHLSNPFHMQAPLESVWRFQSVSVT